MTKSNIKTICKVSKNCEGLTGINLFIAFNALKSSFFLFLLVVFFFVLFLLFYDVVIFNLLIFALAYLIFASPPSPIQR